MVATIFKCARHEAVLENGGQAKLARRKEKKVVLNGRRWTELK